MSAPACPRLSSMLGVLAGILLCSCNAASAEDFYKGKTITIVVGFGPGGGYDLTARLLARHMGRFIPGSPNIIVANMPGASGIKSVNYLYSVAPRDGTVLGTFHSASPFYEATRMPGVQYKSAELSWIGNLSRSVNTVAVWHATGVRTLDDAKTTPVVMAALAGAGIMDTYPRLLNNLFGTKFRIVAGYESTNAVNIAIERGEVQDATTAWNTWKVARPQWVKDSKIVALVQIGLEKDAGLPGVPLLDELAQNEEQQQMFWLISTNVAIEGRSRRRRRFHPTGSKSCAGPSTRRCGTAGSWLTPNACSPTSIRRAERSCRGSWGRS